MVYLTVQRAMTLMTMTGKLRWREQGEIQTGVSIRQQEAFARLWDEERARVWRLTARLSGSPDHADDLTQEVALRALAAWPSFRGGARASTWLHRIAVNVTLRWRESLREQTQPEDDMLATQLPSRDASPEMHAIQRDETDRTRVALDNLPETLRIPLLLHVWEGLKYREIADLLEIPQGTVMSRLNAARKQLRQMLEEKETTHAL